MEGGQNSQNPIHIVYGCPLRLGLNGNLKNCFISNLVILYREYRGTNFLIKILYNVPGEPRKILHFYINGQ